MIKFLISTLKFLLFVLIFIVVVAAAIYVYVNYRYDSKVYSEIFNIPEREYAIVLGARVLASGEPSKVLEHRVNAAVNLYKSGKIEKILMSGDGVTDPHYDEVKVMRLMAIEKGVKPEDIFTDEKGERTIKSCFRAKDQFEIDNAVVITQEFHLSRALYLCNSDGIDAIGYIADQGNYDEIWEYRLREVAASLLAFWEINVGELPSGDIGFLRSLLRGI